MVGGLVIANGRLTLAHQKANTLPTKIFINTMLRLARQGVVAVLTPSIRSIARTARLYGGFNVGWASGGITLLVTTVFVDCYMPNMKKKNLSLNPKITKVLPMITRSSLALVLVGIAITAS